MSLIPFGMSIAQAYAEGLIGPAIFRSRAIGNIVADITIEERHIDTLAITDHPVERDAVISDHAFMMPVEVIIRAGFSNSSRRAQGDPNYVNTMYQQLLALQEARQPFTILTGKRIYQNMLIHRLMTETNETTENSAIIVLECREVIIVDTAVYPNITPNNVQTQPEVTGGTTFGGSVAPQETTTVNADAAAASLPNMDIEAAGP